MMVVKALGGPLATALIGVLLTVTVAGGGWMVVNNLRTGRQINELLEANKKLNEEISRRPIQAITAEDLSRLLAARDEVITRRFETMTETVRILANRPGGVTVIERTTQATPPLVPGAPGAPGRDGKDARDGKDGKDGQSGTPGQPGAGPAIPRGPLITPADAPKAREAAVERMLVDFVPGSLLGCDTVGLEPNQVEILRSPAGTVASTAACVWRIRDQIRLEPPKPLVIPLVKWEGRLLGGWDSTLHGIAGARLTRNLDRTWGIELEGGRHNLPPGGGWWWRTVGTWRAF